MVHTLGLAIHSGDDLRFFVEGGFLAGVGQYREDPPSSFRTEASAVGGYGLVAVTFIIR